MGVEIEVIKPGDGKLTESGGLRLSAKIKQQITTCVKRFIHAMK